KGLPLWELGKIAQDGRPYVDLDKVTYIIGIIGLNECVQYLTGKELHEDEDVFRLGLKIISFMYLKAKEYEKKYGLKVSLEESPAESAARRLAKVDLREYPESKEVIKGSIDKEEFYYTNSIHFSASAPINLVDRIVKQSKFHTLIESGAIIHAFIGEEKPSPASIMNLVKKTWETTKAAQLTISPEFTVCYDCHQLTRGLKEKCSHCGSTEVYGITRIVGYFSRIPNWNKSKLGELNDRHKGNYSLGGSEIESKSDEIKERYSPTPVQASR
ncbi:anaerobic ribonucleoside-triphosphate reductase, partial [bacterium]|nr:anaerobic ribonucleoside-triphosphate reductase [bacterium]